jgi:hypothetical protein
MIHSWQITSKPGETRTDTGRWLAQRSVAGFIVQSCEYSYPTREAAENAVRLRPSQSTITPIPEKKHGQ